ncbi:activator of HSP90 ATPase [Chitiniphilus shinanonensis]|uniref:Activator of HSP90 ATPase n=1 Tax=Chitiniphilus shinanonensis TaxID=553088 RepID=A0ABQ6BXK2_9NEIS|nr:SRPBCC family protein [Chitiniphilus shinanonensis]GLS05885.1 activator of HSP90 ATPase [Chitiniphilus shinanonensis]
MTRSPETSPSVHHERIVIDRLYDATPAQVFAAWASAEAKRRWFGSDEEWENLEYRLDFRVGGQEFDLARPRGGGVQHQYDARIEDIVPDARIVTAYTMSLDGRRISSSLLTVEFLAREGGTRLLFTEQIALFNGADSAAEREGGWRWLLDKLDTTLPRDTVA